MKIDPIFPVPPVVNPPLYKFKRKTYYVDPDEDLKDPLAQVPVEECMSQEDKLFLFIIVLLFVIMLFR